MTTQLKGSVFVLPGRVRGLLLGNFQLPAHAGDLRRHPGGVGSCLHDGLVRVAELILDSLCRPFGQFDLLVPLLFFGHSLCALHGNGQLLLLRLPFDL